MLDALGQRAALVGAAVGQRKNLVIGGAKHRDAAGRGFHDAGAPWAGMSDRAPMSSQVSVTAFIRQARARGS